MAGEQDILAVIRRRGDECYVVMYRKSQRKTVLRALMTWVWDPDLVFDIRDAAKVMRKVRSGRFDKVLNYGENNAAKNDG